ncbi:MAG: DNA-processing protein DprA [Bacteroides sp.]|nr:DNA-processing protein DprA [Bacteroides sp.]MCM1550001.1 DNA-processing protein DprA [Clostridium sp.]
MHPDFYCFWLTFLYRIPLDRLHGYIDYYGTPKAFYEAEPEALDILRPSERRQVLALREGETLLQRWEEQKEKPYRFLSCLHPDYPARLKELKDFPFGIFYEGTLPPKEAPAVAIVGARNATIYGQELAYQFALELGRQGISVISGLANGIDAAAHRGCMDAGGYTMGILGSGINVIYPKENHNLYRSMERSGGILTEYVPDTRPLPMLFPRRNRLISVLSDLVLVVEAREQSGSLITVDFALEQGRDICAVPGRPCDSLSLGCNRLIQQGAKCVLSPADVLEELLEEGRFIRQNQEKNLVNPDLGLAPKEKMVYSCLRLEPKFIDEILCQLQLPVWEAVQILTDLVIKGVIRENPHHYYYKTMEDRTTQIE